MVGPVLQTVWVQFMGNIRDRQPAISECYSTGNKSTDFQEGCWKYVYREWGSQSSGIAFITTNQMT